MEMVCINQQALTKDREDQGQTIENRNKKWKLEVKKQIKYFWHFLILK